MKTYPSEDLLRFSQEGAVLLTQETTRVRPSTENRTHGDRTSREPDNPYASKPRKKKSDSCPDLDHAAQLAKPRQSIEVVGLVGAGTEVKENAEKSSLSFHLCLPTFHLSLHSRPLSEHWCRRHHALQFLRQWLRTKS